MEERKPLVLDENFAGIKHVVCEDDAFKALNEAGVTEGGCFKVGDLRYIILLIVKQKAAGKNYHFCPKWFGSLFKEIVYEIQLIDIA